MKIPSSDTHSFCANRYVGRYVNLRYAWRPILIYEDNIWVDDIDIKDEFFRAAACLSPGKVSHEPYFQLLEGTRSVEAGNPVMDTGLIPINPEDILFDPLIDISLPVLVELQTQLLTCFVSWLDNSSLSVTVLGCRYVVYFLECYLETRKSPNRLQDTLKWGQNNRGQSSLFSFLGPFLAGLCKAIGYSLKVANTVLFEEEDVTTRAMSVNFLTNIASTEILSELDSAIARAKALPESETTQALVHTLKVVEGLVNLEKFADLPMDLFQKSDLSPLILFLASAKSAQQLQKLSSLELPKGVFSKVVQRIRNNTTLPLPLYTIPRERALSELCNIFTSTYQIAKQTSELRTIDQTYHFLKYDIELKSREYSVLTRGLFQLFLVRDDRSIFGSRYKLCDFMFAQIRAVVGPSILIFSLLQPQNLHAQRISAADWPVVSYNYSDLTAALESVLFELLYVYGSNHCRHHQLRSKSLVALDALQVRWEQFEYEIFEKYGLGEQTIMNEAALPVSSYIYLLKLQIMADVVLLGIGLDIYRDYELYLAYWHANNLLDHQIYHFETRIRLILESQINHITVVLPRRLKKLKAGAKKDAAKKTLAYHNEHILPQVQRSLECNEEYAKKPLMALRLLIEGRTQILRAISDLGICRFDAGPHGSLTTHERLYDLRLKPFLSIGVPPVPSYHEYLLSLQPGKRFDRANFEKALATATNTIQFAKSLLHAVMKSMKMNRLDYFRSLQQNKQMLLEYESLIAVTTEDMTVIERLQEVLKSIIKTPVSAYRMETCPGKHRNFPKITIRLKKASHEGHN